MKIEMGESLVYSWLRHVKECQIVQTNWKASPEWELKNVDKITDIMKIANQYFEGKYGYSIFKNNSLEQLMMQAEIDVLGISMSSDRQSIYAIDVAFHEAGLNYGSKDETVSRVIKKCIRTALCIYGHMTVDQAEIIFASPKINPAVLAELEPKISEVNDLFNYFKLGFKTRIIANEEFNGKILAPILIASEGISDTSELFLRSYQMYNMFADNQKVNRNRRASPSRSSDMSVNSNLADDTLKELKIGKLVQTTMKHLFVEEKISPLEIERLTQTDYSKRVFNANLPVLKEVPKDGNIDKLKRDANNYPRYYAYTLSIYGKRYLLSAQWIEHLHRSYYESWLANKL